MDRTGIPHRLPHQIPHEVEHKTADGGGADAAASQKTPVHPFARKAELEFQRLSNFWYTDILRKLENMCSQDIPPKNVRAAWERIHPDCFLTMTWPARFSDEEIVEKFKEEISTYLRANKDKVQLDSREHKRCLMRHFIH